MNCCLMSFRIVIRSTYSKKQCFYVIVHLIRDRVSRPSRGQTPATQRPHLQTPTADKAQRNRPRDAHQRACNNPFDFIPHSSNTQIEINYASSLLLSPHLHSLPKPNNTSLPHSSNTRKKNSITSRSIPYQKQTKPRPSCFFRVPFLRIARAR